MNVMRWTKRRVGGMVVGMGVVAAVLGGCAQWGPAYMPGAGGAAPLEMKYAAAGRWEVSTGTARVNGHGYSLWYPTNLGADGFKHPILTWGNGTLRWPSLYADTLEHLASWGFVVIASDSGWVGTGDLMLEGANYMITQNGNAGSVFYQKLDTSKVGALGHSQGATGTLNATLLSGGLIKTAVTIELPDPVWWNARVPKLNELKASVFLIHGTADFIATETAARRWYEQAGGAAVKAACQRVGHNVILRKGNQLQGYITAWEMYMLQGDTAARGVFAGAVPELGGHPGWQDFAGKNLP